MEVDEQKMGEISNQTTKPAANENKAVHFDNSIIRECAERGIGSFNMDSLSDPQKYLDNSLINEVFGKLPVNGFKEWKLEANEYERFSCHQWEEDKNYFYFTLLQKDESCCLSMYLCVSDKSGKILAIRQLGVTGGDGGWVGNDLGERIEFGSFKVLKKSSNDEEHYENGINNGYKRTFESTQLLIEWNSRINDFNVDTLKFVSIDTLILYKKTH